MKEINKIQEELKELAPGFSRLEKKNPFEIPHNYFQEMQEEVMSKIHTPVEPAKDWFWEKIGNQIAWLFKPKPALALATLSGAILLFINIGDSSNQSEPFFEGLATETIEAYIEENIEDFEDTDLLLLADNESIDFFNNRNSSEDYIDELIDELAEEDIMDIF